MVKGHAGSEQGCLLVADAVSEPQKGVQFHAGGEQHRSFLTAAEVDPCGLAADLAIFHAQNQAAHFDRQAHAQRLKYNYGFRSHNPSHLYLGERGGGRNPVRHLSTSKERIRAGCAEEGPPLPPLARSWILPASPVPGPY